jgi:hypothetical protein
MLLLLMLLTDYVRGNFDDGDADKSEKYHSFSRLSILYNYLFESNEI